MNSNHNDGNVVDEVCPVVILHGSSTIEAELEYKTPQYLATLSLISDFDSNKNDEKDPSFSTIPILCQQRYLVMGSRLGYVCFWDLRNNESIGAKLVNNEDEKQSSSAATNKLSGERLEASQAMVGSQEGLGNSPDFVFDLETGIKGKRFPAVQITEVKSSFLESLHHKDNCDDASKINYIIAAVTMVGTVYLISVTESQMEDSNQIFFRVVPIAIWNTGRLNACSVAALDNSATIVVGYESNFIEAWDLSLDLSLNDKKSKYYSRAELSWRAAYEASPPLSIRSILQIPTAVPDTPTSIPDEDHQFLLFTLQPAIGNSSSSTSNLIEVIDLKSIRQQWRNLRLNSEANGDELRDKYVLIDGHWVLPEYGMEIRDSATQVRVSESENLSSDTLPFPVHLLPSFGTSSIFPFPPSEGSSSTRTIVALADGTVALVEAEFRSGCLSWGLLRSFDQLVFSFPVVGVGGVSYQYNNGEGCCSNSVACCLRGGTTYLIPIRDDASQRESHNILVFPLPHDVDLDSYTRQLQGFTSGNILLTRYSPDVSNQSEDLFSILVYVWPGGLIDVYNCGLVMKRYPKPRILNDIVFLRELDANGSLIILQIFLESADTENLKTRGAHWMLARDEILTLKGNRIRLDDFRCNKFPRFVSLCKLLASE